MTLDEAIKHCMEVARSCDCQVAQCDEDGYEGHIKAENEQCAADHRQLAEWLTELKQWRRVYGVCPSYEMCIPECKEGYNAQIAEYKRLLKAAVEDNKRVLRENFGDICLFCKHYSNSEARCRKPHNGSGSWCCENAEWRYAAEALKLIEND